MVRVFMVSRLALFGDGVQALLSREKEVEIVGRETDFEAAIAQIQRLCPDVVILDSSLQAGEVAATAARVVAARPNTKVVAMSLEGNIVTVFRQEQKTVHEIQDLLRAINNSTSH